MKKILLASGVLAMLVSTACTTYDLYPEDYAKVLTIKNAGTMEVTVYSTDETAKIPFIVMKGGANPEQGTTATLKVMNDEEFAAYQETSGNLIYVQLPESCYSFSETEQTNADNYKFVGESDRYRNSTLYLRPGKIQEWVNENAELIASESLIPVVAIELQSEATVNELGDVSIVIPTVEVPTLSFDIVGNNGGTAVLSKAVNLLSTSATSYKPEAELSIPCSNPWGFTVKLKFDKMAVADFNQENGTMYYPIDPARVKYQDTYYFAPGVTSLPLDVEFSLEDVAPADMNDVYVLPLTLDGESVVWDDANKNPGENLVIPTSTILLGLKVINFMPVSKINLSDADVYCNNVAGYDGGGVAALLDDDTSSFYHSHWQSSGAGCIEDDAYGTYLEVNLPKPMTYFGFMIQNRNHAGNALKGAPTHVKLFGSNDDGASWTEFADINIVNTGDDACLPSALSKAYWGVDIEEDGAKTVTIEPYSDSTAYAKIRFCVLSVGGGDFNTGFDPVGTWWAAAGWALYGDQ